MNASNQKHSIPFYISPRLFRNKRFQQRRNKWAARLKKIQLHSYSARIATPPSVALIKTNKGKTATTTTTSKTDRTKRPNQQQQQREQQNNRQSFRSLKADVTIDLLSDDDDEDNDNKDNVASIIRTSTPNPGGGGFITKKQNNIVIQPTNVQPDNFYLHPSGSFQLSMVPNITLVPVQQLNFQELDQQHLKLEHQHQMVLDSSGDARRKRKSHRPRKRYAPPATVSLPTDSNNISIVLTDDEDDYQAFKSTNHINVKCPPQLVKQMQSVNRSPPPLAPLSQQIIVSETVEDVTVSLVPRTATTAHCKQKQQQLNAFNNTNCKQLVINTNGIIGGGVSAGSCGSSSSSTIKAINGTTHDAFPMLPDETTVHTVIANRIYELSLSKLREGLASSGMPEFANDSTTTTTTMQKLSPTLRSRKSLPVIATPPLPPISLKLSSDLSISLISDDEGETGSDMRPEALNAASIADEAHAAAKLLQQQHPQLSVVQHLQYHPNVGGAAVPAVVAQQRTSSPTVRRAAAANIHGGVATTTTPTPRRRKLG